MSDFTRSAPVLRRAALVASDHRWPGPSARHDGVASHHPRPSPRRSTNERVGYAPGAYDLFHIGHLNLLRHAKAHCDHLIAGRRRPTRCSSSRRASRPVIPLAERLEIVRHIDFVDDVYAETEPDKLDTWRERAVRRDLQGRRLARHPEGRQARARLRRGRRRGRVLPLHDAHVEHRAAPSARGASTATIPQPSAVVPRWPSRGRRIRAGADAPAAAAIGGCGLRASPENPEPRAPVVARLAAPPTAKDR